jgi:hypothetical protein
LPAGDWSGRLAGCRRRVAGCFPQHQARQLAFGEPRAGITRGWDLCCS